MLDDFDIKAWVNACAWAPSGKSIAFCGHNATMLFVDFDDDKRHQVVNHKELPLTKLSYLSDTSLFAVGFDRNPQLWEKKGDAWECSKQLDDLTSSSSSGKKKKKGGFGSAFAKFNDADKLGKSAGSAKTENKYAIKTQHKNYICDISVVSDKSVTTCGIDGRIITWTA